MDGFRLAMVAFATLVTTGLAVGVWGQVEAAQARERAEAPCPEDQPECQHFWYFFGAQAAHGYSVVGWLCAGIGVLGLAGTFWRRRQVASFIRED